MKTYLNREEKTDIVKLSALIGSIEYFTVEWSKRNNLSKEEENMLLSAKELLDKILESIMGRFNNSVSSQIYKEAVSTELLCVSKARAKVIDDNTKKANESIVVDRNTLDLLALKALYFCNPCSEANQDNCELRKIFEELNIDPYDCEAKGCQYCIRKKRVRKKSDKSDS